MAVAALLVLAALWPSRSYAAPAEPLLPPQGIPGWLQDALDSLQTALVKTLQDLARIGGVLLWSVLKVCGLVGLFGADFSALFGTVVTEALNAVITGSVRDLIRGSLMVSLGIFGLSLLARPFLPGLRLVSFQRAAIWGIAIQAYLVSAPTIYAELETWRVDLAEEVAGAVSTGAIPGCSGSVVEVLLCITGTSPAEVPARLAPRSFCFWAKRKKFLVPSNQRQAHRKEVSRMRNYEFTFIIAPTVEDDNIQAVVDKVSAWIESIDGQVTTVDHWGRRELAYQIQDFGEGSYVFMETRLEPNTLNELERNLKLDLDIIRYLLVRVEE